MARRRMEHEAEREGAESEAAARKGMELLLGNQTILLHHMNEMTKRWLERRREDLDAARQSLDDMGGCENWGEVLRVQQQWMLGSMRRLTADLTEFASGALSLSQRAASRFGETSEAAAREWQRAGSEAVSTLSAAGAKPRAEGMGEAE
ncbi:MAG TPA: phasin family protein [Stellaceae bacterium]|jgi:Phasin protein|nr:phasin family protein [Stellaceae bacterium]